MIEIALGVIAVIILIWLYNKHQANNAAAAVAAADAKARANLAPDVSADGTATSSTSTDTTGSTMNADGTTPAYLEVVSSENYITGTPYH